MAWIEIKTGSRLQRSWQLVNLDIYKDIRWLSQTKGFAIYGIPKFPHGDDEHGWDQLFYHKDLKPVLREFKRIKRQLNRRGDKNDIR